MDAKTLWSLVRKHPTWKPEDYKSVDKLKAFCIDKRRILDKGSQPDTNLEFIWGNVAYAVWGALRLRGEANIPREPSPAAVVRDPSLGVRALDEVIRLVEQTRDAEPNNRCQIPELIRRINHQRNSYHRHVLDARPNEGLIVPDVDRLMTDLQEFIECAKISPSNELAAALQRHREFLLECQKIAYTDEADEATLVCASVNESVCPAWDSLKKYARVNGYELCDDGRIVNRLAARETGSAGRQDDDETEPAKPTTRKQTVDVDDSTVDRSLSCISMSVPSWGSLAIGIDEDGSFLGVTPAPDFQSIFPKESAIDLPLKGKRWTKLLNLLARSTDGCTAKKKDLFVEYGYLSQSVKDEEIDDILDDSGRMSEIKTVTKSLTSAIGDLSRQLRKHVSAEDDSRRKNPPLGTADKTSVKAGFVCRYLVRDSNGKLRFGASD